MLSQFSTADVEGQVNLSQTSRSLDLYSELFKNRRLFPDVYTVNNNISFWFLEKITPLSLSLSVY